MAIATIIMIMTVTTNKTPKEAPAIIGIGSETGEDSASVRSSSGLVTVVSPVGVGEGDGEGSMLLGVEEGLTISTSSMGMHVVFPSS